MSFELGAELFEFNLHFGYCIPLGKSSLLFDLIPNLQNMGVLGLRLSRTSLLNLKQLLKLDSLSSYIMSPGIFESS